MGLMTRLDMYVDDAREEGLDPAYSLLFHDAGRAEDVRRELLADEGLPGIGIIEVVIVTTDEKFEIAEDLNRPLAELADTSFSARSWRSVSWLGAAVTDVFAVGVTRAGQPGSPRVALSLHRHVVGLVHRHLT